jgi:hypothetical protein
MYILIEVLTTSKEGEAKAQNRQEKRLCQQAAVKTQVSYVV